mmetsp:Transcript_8839/g.18894  ORF Transcript_8839/g.18894 Transcript_8839/m.18894 type:complete len:210 (-) Transcript_8839:298-927(-)
MPSSSNTLASTRLRSPLLNICSSFSTGFLYAQPSSRSASSKMTCFTRDCSPSGVHRGPYDWPAVVSSVMSPAGVATITSGGSAGGGLLLLTWAAVTSGAPDAERSEWATAITCWQSCALGQSTTTWYLLGLSAPASRCFCLYIMDTTGARYARVFPLPVSAAMTASDPCDNTGIASSWTLDGRLKPAALSAWSTSSLKPRSTKECAPSA